MTRTRLLLLAFLALSPGLAAAAGIDDFVGTYVGTADVLDSDGNVEEQRDMDIMIAKTSDGFRIEWVNVSLVDGRRDLPGVERRAQTLEFRDEGNGRFVVESRRSLFERRKQTDMFAGAPMSWARIEDGKLGVFTLVVLPDGSYELQVYERVLTEDGLDIEFVRLDEGERVRTINGRTIRVADAEEDEEEDG